MSNAAGLASIRGILGDAFPAKGVTARNRHRFEQDATANIAREVVVRSTNVRRGRSERNGWKWVEISREQD